MSILQTFIEHKNYRLDGETGVKNLCRLIKALGYTDSQYFGQFEGGSYGLLINFLEDNSGCMEAMLEWIEENMDSEWEENLDSELPGWSVSLEDSGDLVQDGFKSEDDAYTWLYRMYGADVEGYIVEQNQEP